LRLKLYCATFNSVDETSKARPVVSLHIHMPAWRNWQTR
jgi:hypothetical protein